MITSEKLNYCPGTTALPTTHGVSTLVRRSYYGQYMCEGVLVRRSYYGQYMCEGVLVRRNYYGQYMCEGVLVRRSYYRQCI